MDRRTALTNLIIPPAATLMMGCRWKTVKFDRQPKRGFFEDRWSGYYFDTLFASFRWKIAHPCPSLSRPDPQPMNVYRSDGSVLHSTPGTAVIRPTHADVELSYLASSSFDSKINVTVHWPTPPHGPLNQQRQQSETQIAMIEFRHVRDLIDGSGSFRCDDDNHYYGPGASKSFRRNNNIKDGEEPGSKFATIDAVDTTVPVTLRVSNQSPPMQHEHRVAYRDTFALKRLIELAVPDIGS